MSGYANRAQRLRQSGADYRGVNLSNHRPKRLGYAPSVEPGAYSEHAARVEAALCELEAIVKRLER